MKKPSGCSIDSSEYNLDKFRDYNQTSTSTNIYTRGNPDPKNFKILKYAEVNNHLVILINYPDCNNYEGDKILVYKNKSFAKISKLKNLDPHFCEHKGHVSPYARFAPTSEGYEMAISFCKILHK